MPKQIINPSNMAKPAGYSYAVKKRGTPVFISGQVGIDAEGRVVGEGDAAAQTAQAFDNLRTVVEASGGSMNDIVKITIFVTDPAYRGAVVAARQRYFTEGEYPASTYLVVAALAVPQLLVEVEAVAMIDG
jgi:enamine deaminase RidA (YjgF/YER057c/UK114 family)